MKDRQTAPREGVRGPGGAEPSSRDGGDGRPRSGGGRVGDEREDDAPGEAEHAHEQDALLAGDESVDIQESSARRIQG
jgi:hypothetical protein